MNSIRASLLPMVLTFQDGVVLAAQGSGPGAMGSGGTAQCDGMMGMMGGFMIVPIAGSLLLLTLLILAIVALVKYLRHG